MGCCMGCCFGSRSAIEPQDKEFEGKDIIISIYNQSSQTRYVEGQYQYYIRDEEDQSALFKNYGITQLKLKNELKIHCQGFRPVRGDGNCFYTAFAFQLLQMLLIEFSEQEYKEFIELNTNMQLQLERGQQFIKKEMEETLYKMFINKLNMIRKTKIEERNNQLIQQFKEYYSKDENKDCYLYALSIIFLKNLTEKAISKSPNKELLLDHENILMWEKECNSNEIVIEALSTYLKIRVKTILFVDNTFKLNEYNKEFNRTIILLIKPGHYNIGIPTINE